MVDTGKRFNSQSNSGVAGSSPVKLEHLEVGREVGQGAYGKVLLSKHK